MFDTIHITLLIGPLPVPLPAPLPVTEALQRIEVNSSRERSGFQMTFSLGKTSPLQLGLLPAGYFDPMLTRVVIVATVRGFPQVLMDGVVTRQDMQPGNQPGQSTLTLTGEDLSVLMDVMEVRMPFPAMSDDARINTILLKYLAFGVMPQVIPAPVFNVDSPTSRFDTQQGTDRAYIKSLAAQCGYSFYVEPGPIPAQSVAYFGPDIRPVPPQPALNVNMDGETNVETLSFSADGLVKRTTVMFLYDQLTKKIPIVVTIPDVNPMHPPLGLRPMPPAHITFTEDTTRLSPTEAAKRVFGIMRQSTDAVRGTGTLNVASYGRALRARALVGVRGAGTTYDGFYYVDSVTDSIKRGEYKQNFQLSRDGMGTQTPVVVP